MFASRSFTRARLLALLALALLVAGAVGCTGGRSGGSSADKPKTSDVILASTTSTEDSGLFEVLIPAFEEANPEYKVKVVAVGTGEALELGERKDADVVLVHAKKKEESFVASGFGESRRDVMYNDFVVVGPKDDPAGIKGMKSASDAFKRIAETSSIFVSRGDESGTHSKELSIWTSATVEATGQAWYKSTGQGMGETLRVATELEGYTLADRATWLTNESQLDLALLLEGDKTLFNQYGVIPVVGASNPEGAKAFADWIVSPEGQQVIEEFGKEKYGLSLFVPNASGE